MLKFTKINYKPGGCRRSHDNIGEDDTIGEDNTIGEELDHNLSLSESFFFSFPSSFFIQLRGRENSQDKVPGTSESRTWLG